MGHTDCTVGGHSDVKKGFLQSERLRAVNQVRRRESQKFQAVRIGYNDQEERECQAGYPGT